MRDHRDRRERRDGLRSRPSPHPDTNIQHEESFLRADGPEPRYVTWSNESTPDLASTNWGQVVNLSNGGSLLYRSRLVSSAGTLFLNCHADIFLSEKPMLPLQIPPRCTTFNHRTILRISLSAYGRPTVPEPTHTQAGRRCLIPVNILTSTAGVAMSNRMRQESLRGLARGALFDMSMA